MRILLHTSASLDTLKNMIVKVQLPLLPLDGPTLIYNEDRSFEKLVPTSEELRILLGNQEKSFWKTITRADGELCLVQPIEDPGW